jgi:arylsulfatase A-like enzyme
VKFIREHRAGPFFVYLPHTMVHAPLAASDRFRGKSGQGLLADAIEELDWSVGQIMETLKDLQLDDETLVIFTSDNGAAAGSSAPWRGKKGSNFEGGVREPCIMRWPGRIPAGTTCDQIAGNIDLLPTFAKLVGAELPKDRVLDGRDISPLLFDPKAGPVRDTHLYFAASQSLAAIRQGEWKLFLTAPPAGGKAKGKAAKGAKAKNAPSRPVLYHLASDKSETMDVAADHPNIVARLQAEAARLEAEIKEHRRGAGEVSREN